MKANEFRNQMTNIMFNSDVIIVEDGDLAHQLSLIVTDILQTYLDTITDTYLSREQISLLKHQISELSGDMAMLLSHADLLHVWLSIEAILERWEQSAIFYELYEGVVNFNKLREMV
jgi:hypothetical protein